MYPEAPPVTDAGVKYRHQEMQAERARSRERSRQDLGPVQQETTTLSPEARAVPGAIVMNPLAAVREESRAELWFPVAEAT